MQFGQLAKDHLGSRVWFTTDLPARGSNQEPYSRIWVADADGNLAIAAERPLSIAHRLVTRPQVSRDGSLLAWDATYYCQLGSTCRLPDPVHGVVVAGGGVETELEGRIHLSRNGRWLLRESYATFAPAFEVELIDRQTGSRRQIPVANPVELQGGLRITNNGSALIYAGGLWLIHGATFRFSRLRWNSCTQDKDSRPLFMKIFGDW